MCGQKAMRWTALHLVRVVNGLHIYSYWNEAAKHDLGAKLVIFFVPSLIALLVNLANKTSLMPVQIAFSIQSALALVGHFSLACKTTLL